MSTDTFSRTRYLRHPSWAYRNLRNTLRWHAAGKPIATPLAGGGHLLACPHGRGVIKGWHLHEDRWAKPMTADDLWDRLTAKHPVTRLGYIDGCDQCKEAA